MLIIAYSIFLSNLLFGILVKAGIVDNRRLRFVHHALYFLVVASLVIAIVAAATDGAARRAWMLAAVGLLLFGMPFFRGRGRGHWVYATFCGAAYSAAVMMG